MKTPDNRGGFRFVKPEVISQKMHRVVHQSFAVEFDYPVVFTRGVFRPANRALIDALCRKGERRLHRAAVFVDDAVAPAADAAAAYFEAHRERAELVAPPRRVPGGEAIKNDERQARQMLEFMVSKRMDRQSFVIAVGGGAVLDAVGFAASLVHRGLRLVRLPTTVLAQNDAGVGVKNAVNGCGSKNLIGTFSPPFAVINDLDFPRTLPDDAWTDGVAEAFKVAIIKDADFFHDLCELAPALRARDDRAMEHLVIRCAELHLDHIRSNGDPFEFGQARPLDFGHWSAHRLEAMSGFAVRHGQAVALGVALDAQYASLKGWLSPAELEAIHAGLARAGFVLWHELMDRAGDLLEGLKDFQEHLGGELCVTMPIGIGRKFEVNEIDTGLMARSISLLKRAYTEKSSASSDVLP